MKPQVYFGIAIRIIILVAIGMLITYVNPHLREFFGDTLRDRAEHMDFGIDPMYDWNARHYWYFWGMFMLFILSLINCIIGISKLVTKHYPGIF